MKHTPGPWNVKEHSYTRSESKVRISPYTPRYCIVYGVDHDANARLIAAAPDACALLDTLRAILTQFPDGKHINWQSFKADIDSYFAKTEGH